VYAEMKLNAVMERVWGCTWRPKLSKLRDVIGGPDRPDLEMHFAALIKLTPPCTWRLKLPNFGAALGGQDCSGLEEYCEAGHLEAVDREGGAMGGLTLFIGSLMNVGMLEINYNQVRREMRHETGLQQETVDHAMMQYSVYAVLGVNS